MAKKQISVYAPGTMVFIGNKGERSIEAEITAIVIRESIKYEVMWWHDNKRYELWLPEDQMSIKNNIKKVPVGFK